MSHALDRWPHRWFGVWREFGAPYSRCPSIHDFVFPTVARSYDARLPEYLTGGQTIASTSRSSFPDPFSGARRSGSVSFRTDGVWVWLDDLPDHVENHGVALPTAFLMNIEANQYRPPAVDPSEFSQLEWPPIAQDNT